MCTVWHVEKYKITFQLVINSRRISGGPAVEKHWSRQQNEVLPKQNAHF